MADATDPAAFSSALQKAYLWDAATGTWSNKKATPKALAPLIDYLRGLTDYVVASADALMDDKTQAPASGSPEVIGWQARLAYYQGKLDNCIATGKGDDPKCSYWDVVNPLLWGWMGPEEPGCPPESSGVTCTQHAADAGTPMLLARMLSERTQWQAEGGVDKFAQYAKESAADAAKEGLVWGKVAVDYAKGLADRPWELISKGLDVLPWVAGAAIVVGLGYLVSKARG